MPEEEDLPDSACDGWPAEYVVEVAAAGAERISALQIVRAINAHPLASAAAGAIEQESTYELVWGELHRQRAPGSSLGDDVGLVEIAPHKFLHENSLNQFPFEYASVNCYRDFVDVHVSQLFQQRRLHYELKWELNMRSFLAFNAD